MNTVMKPVINLNGTSRETLVQHRIDVLDALRTTLELMLELRPHGRDYQGHDEQYKADLELHNKRFNELYALKSAIEDEALAIRENA